VVFDDAEEDTMKQLIWLSFDLGIRGDYESMYQFLDNHHAKECANNVAALTYEYDGDLLAKLKAELTEAVTFDKRSRIYVIYQNPVGKPRGRFIVGKRKQAVWTGFGVETVDEEDVGE
jgi:hypothetical protein